MFSRLLRLFHKENGDQGDTRPRQKESGILSCKKGRRKSFWGRHMSAGKTSSQNCNITNHMKNMNKLEDMKFYIRKINAERLELFRILDIDMNTDLNYSFTHTYLLKECNHLKEKVRMLLNENRKLLVEQADQETSYGEEKSSVMSPARTYIPSAKQQQV
uniref:Disks large homolog 5 N-terminal domain-containing protein n=1 Tax=Mus spicilegus TaxID=10103 RepID=A0A8C6HHH0_MUSSI